MASSSKQIDVGVPAEGAGARRERLSALVDGELPPHEAAALCAAWAEDAELRATWHGYQLIGDVLRSEDLASTGSRDRDFLSALSARLAQEPVVLAPAARVEARPRRRTPWNWVAPAAVAASVVVVSGWMLRPAEAPADKVARVTAPVVPPVAQPIQVGSPQALPAAPAAPSAALVMIRDPQLDGYFAAHKQFAGRAAVGMPAGYVRNASVEVPAR